MNYRLRSVIPRTSSLGKISVIIGRAVVFDLGGDCRIFPYIDWSKLKPGASKDLLAFSRRVEDMACEAVEKAVRVHAVAGRPVHFVDGRGRIIKQMPDGRRFVVSAPDDGEEVVLKEL